MKLKSIIKPYVKFIDIKCFIFLMFVKLGKLPTAPPKKCIAHVIRRENNGINTM